MDFFFKFKIQQFFSQLMIQWLLKLTFESRKSTAMSGSILIMSLMSWMWPAHVAKVYTKSWADLLLLFITKEWTKMAVSCEAQTYKKKYFCRRNSNGTTMWSPQINLFAQFPNFQSNLHLQLKFPLNDTPYYVLTGWKHGTCFWLWQG